LCRWATQCTGQWLPAYISKNFKQYLFVFIIFIRDIGLSRRSMLYAALCLMDGILSQVIWHTAAPLKAYCRSMAYCVGRGYVVFHMHFSYSILQHFVDILKISIEGVNKMLRIFSILHNSSERILFSIRPTKHFYAPRKHIVAALYVRLNSCPEHK
jgi:hypothetical protein